MAASRLVPDRLPVLVLTGFLGSGKTTLLNRLLRSWPRTAVLINEFGAEPVDPRLLEEGNLPLVTLSGGCLCCQVRGALPPVLRNLRMDWGKPGRPEFDRLIIETSGVASPEPILDTLLRDRWLSARCRLLAVVTTVSAATGEEQLDRFPEAQAQVAWADVLVVTQSDLAAPDFLARLEDLLDRLAAATPRIPAVHGDLDPASLLGQAAGFRRLPDARDLPEHRFRSVSVHLPAPMPWPVLAETLEGLLARHGDSLVRIKGVVHLPDAFEPVAVHAAGGRLYPPASLPVRLDDDALGRLVFITAGSAEQLAEDLASAGGGLFGAIRM